MTTISYFLIPNLGIGGSSIDEDDNAYLLDTGYQIIKKNEGTYHVPKAFANYSEQYVKSTKSNVQRDLGEGQLANELIHEYEVAKLLASHNCRVSQEVRQLQRWLLGEMPDTAGQYLYKKRGYVVTLLGEALRLQQCQAVKSYEIH